MRPVQRQCPSLVEGKWTGKKPKYCRDQGKFVTLVISLKHSYQRKFSLYVLQKKRKNAFRSAVDELLSKISGIESF